MTVPASHTVLGEQMGSAAVYVGMTRDRETNTLHLVAEDMADARAQFIEAMEHDRADRGLAEATERRAEDDPRVPDAARSLVAAQTEQAALKDRHDRERLALLAQELGAERVRRDPIRGRFIRPEREARNAHAQATEARHEAGELRGLPPEEAAAVIEAKQAAAEQTQQLSADRARRLRGTFDRASAQTELCRDGPSLGL